MRTAAATSAVVVGKQMTAASPASIEASRRYSASSVGWARTRSGASARDRSATRAAESEFRPPAAPAVVVVATRPVCRAKRI